MRPTALRLSAASLLPLFLVARGPASGQQPAQIRETTFSVEFPGGTVAEFIEAVSGKLPDLNIVQRPEVKDVLVPPVSLKEVTAQNALKLLEAATIEGGVALQVQAIGGGGSGVIYVLAGKGRAPQRPSAKRPPGPEPVEIRLHVYSLRHLSGNDAKEAEEVIAKVLSAIDTALEIQAEVGEKPVIKIHPDTMLLMVKGSPEQLVLVEQVLEAMPRDFHKAGADSAPSQDVLAQLQAKVAKLEAEVAELKKAANPPK